MRALQTTIEPGPQPTMVGAVALGERIFDGLVICHDEAALMIFLLIYIFGTRFHNGVAEI
ncbi:hypothetical protein D3C80_2127050 [compost metagenome]